MDLATIVTTINDIIWAPPLVALCLGAGVFLSIYLKFPQFRHFGKMAKLTVSAETSDEGITPFQAFATTVGSLSVWAISPASQPRSSSAARVQCSGCGSSRCSAARPHL